MYSRIANKLTAFTNYSVDWSGIGRLFKSGTHHYTWEEKAIRVGMVAFSAMTGFLGAYFNNAEKTKCTSLTIGILSAALGFYIAHRVVLDAKIAKRKRLYNDSETISARIRDTLNTRESPLSQFQLNFINDLICHIKNISLSDEHSSRATETLGRRKRLLTNLESNLENYINSNDFWDSMFEDIAENLNQVVSITPRARM